MKEVWPLHFLEYSEAHRLHCHSQDQPLHECQTFSDVRLIQNFTESGRLPGEKSLQLVPDEKYENNCFMCVLDCQLHGSPSL